MPKITIDITESQALTLADKSMRLHVTPEALLQRELDFVFSQINLEFDDSLYEILCKNAELSRRLADK